MEHALLHRPQGQLLGQQQQGQSQTSGSGAAAAIGKSW
jgi:hypothetical protein